MPEFPGSFVLSLCHEDPSSYPQGTRPWDWVGTQREQSCMRFTILGEAKMYLGLGGRCFVKEAEKGTKGLCVMTWMRFTRQGQCGR